MVVNVVVGERSFFHHHDCPRGCILLVPVCQSSTRAPTITAEDAVWHRYVADSPELRETGSKSMVLWLGNWRTRISVKHRGTTVLAILGRWRISS